MRRCVSLSATAMAILLGCVRNAPPPKAPQEVPIGLAPSPPEAEPSPAGVEGQASPESDLVPAKPPEDGGGGVVSSDVVVATTALPGGGRALDPITFLASARRTANLGNDAQLVSIVAERVNLAGTLDLQAVTSPSIEYRFKRRESASRTAAQSLPPLPMGADTASRPVTTVRVDALGMHAPVTRAEVSPASLPAPRCVTKRLMAVAKRAGVPTGATGSLAYGDTGGPHWVLRFEGAGINLFIRDPACTIDTKAPPPQMGM